MVMRLLWMWLLCLAALPAWAQEVQLVTDVQQLATGQRTSLAVIVTGGSPTAVPDIATPEGVSVSYNGQSQTTSIINGRMERYIKFVYDMAARKEGSWVVGPATVSVQTAKGDATVASNTVRLVVGPAAATVPDGDLSIETSFDVAEAWQGQIVLFHYTLRSRKELSSGRWFNLPDAGLLAPKDARPERREYVVNDERGAELVDQTIQPFLITGSGPLTWPPPALEADVVVQDGRQRTLGFFRRTRREVYTAQPLELLVRPLPPPPPDFSGLVGNFRLRIRVPTQRVKVGESISMSIHLDGDGSVDGYRLPPAPDLEGARVYEGSARVRGMVRQGAYIGGANFERTIVPTREGPLTLPDIEIVVFSPEVGDYVTLTARGALIQVDPGEDGELDLTSFANTPDADTDVAAPAAPDTVHPAWGSGPGRILPWATWMPGAWLLAMLPGLGILVHTASSQWKQRRTHQAQASAVASPRQRLARLPPPGPQRLTALDEALRLALAQAADMPIATLERAAALATLPPELAARVERVWGVLDRARFAADAVPADLDAQVRDVVTALEAP